MFGLIAVVPLRGCACVVESGGWVGHAEADERRVRMGNKSLNFEWSANFLC